MKIIFLQFVAQKLLGEPTKRTEGGSRWWFRCPFHSPDRNPSFCTLPPKEGCKDWFKCWSCGKYGDEWDLLAQMFPADDYAYRKLRYRQLYAEFERLGGQAPAPIKPKAAKVNHRSKTLT